MEVIFSYTRSQAISDGVLIDVTQVAKTAGFCVPVAITAAVQNLIENHPRLTGGVWNIFTQDVDGRLYDVLWMSYMNALQHTYQNTFLYEVILPHYEEVTCEDGSCKNKLKKKAVLKTVVSGGDDGEPVITIMLPYED